MVAVRDARQIAKAGHFRGTPAAAIDACVGNRVRLKRLLLGMSQTRLADSLGLTFQQIQKYEKGTNRISAGRLFQLANILEAPIDYFFEDVERDAIGGKEATKAAALDFLGSTENLQLSAAFMRIADPILRKRIVAFLRSLDETDAK
jgi:transcriptional regulator with XRE-family HTH domain